MWGTSSSTTEHHLEQGKQSLASGQFADALHHYSKAISESSKYTVMLDKRCCRGKKSEKGIAESGFDPPTFGLWAQHAPAAPLC